MEKRLSNRNMAIAVCFALAAMSLFACKEKPVSNTVSEEVPSPEDAVSSEEAPAQDARPQLLNVTCVNQSMKMTDGDYDAAEGICYSFELDDETAKAYPELSDYIETVNKDTYDDFNRALAKAAAGSILQKNDGWGMTYAEDSTARVTRADGRAFSYGVEHYSFLGGAHGYTFFEGKTIDPVTCEEIRFSDVVTSSSDFADICFEELIKQEPDLEDYFDQLESDKENLLESIDKDANSRKSEPVWTLSYEGITIYFRDYSMGSYAAGSHIVDIPYESHKEIFNEDYFTYESDTPDINDHVKKIDNDDPQEIEPLHFVMSVGYEFEGTSSNGIPYTVSKCDKLIIPDEYKKLKARFDKINSDNAGYLKSGFSGYSSQLSDEYRSEYGDKGPYYDYEYGIHQYVTRADDTVFSTVQSYQEDKLYNIGNRKLVGINLDTQSGEDVPLDKVVTDMSGLKKAFKRILKKEYYEEETEDKIYSEFCEQLDGKDLVSNEDFSWTAGYEGITVYCNTLCNYSLPDMNNDAFTLFIPYSYDPELFDAKYTKVPASYAYQIPVSALFPGHAYLDMEYDGNYVPLGISVGPDDEYREFDAISFGVGSSWERMDGIWANDLLATVVHTPDDEDLLYVQFDKEEGYPDLHIYSFDYKKAREIEFTPELSLIYEIDHVSSDKEHQGRIMTDPMNISVRATDDTMGARSVNSECCIDSSGNIRSKDGKWDYSRSEYMDLKALKDIRTKSGVISAGTTVSPVSIQEVRNDVGDVEADKRILKLSAPNKKFFTLELEKDGWQWKYKGEELEVLFDGYFIFPG